jgi:EAL domain-containing protein (putative c-di-GMP-specific phosphodiesterase class I)
VANRRDGAPVKSQGLARRVRREDLLARALEIDRSFIGGVVVDDDRNLVPTILELARTLQLDTAAEVVETLEQGTRLADLGCELAGFYFSKPVPAAQFSELPERPEIPAV